VATDRPFPSSDDPRHRNPPRRILSGMGTDLVAAPALLGAGSPVLAQQQTLPASPAQAPALQTMQHPLNECPWPPFPQQQDPSGLARSMQPGPDHGETSYS
jgi:hypothetical protein